MGNAAGSQFTDVYGSAWPHLGRRNAGPYTFPRRLPAAKTRSRCACARARLGTLTRSVPRGPARRFPGQRAANPCGVDAATRPRRTGNPRAAAAAVRSPLLSYPGFPVVPGDQPLALPGAGLRASLTRGGNVAGSSGLTCPKCGCHAAPLGVGVGHSGRGPLPAGPGRAPGPRSPHSHTRAGLTPPRTRRLSPIFLFYI